MKFVSIPRTIEANQFFRPKMTPEEQVKHFAAGNGTPGVQVKDYGNGGLQYYVITAQGQKVQVIAGEWIVAEKDGRGHYPIADDLFPTLYKPAT